MSREDERVAADAPLLAEGQGGVVDNSQNEVALEPMRQAMCEAVHLYLHLPPGEQAKWYAWWRRGSMPANSCISWQNALATLASITAAACDANESGTQAKFGIEQILLMSAENGFATFLIANCMATNAIFLVWASLSVLFKQEGGQKTSRVVLGWLLSFFTQIPFEYLNFRDNYEVDFSEHPIWYSTILAGGFFSILLLEYLSFSMEGEFTRVMKDLIDRMPKMKAFMCCYKETPASILLAAEGESKEQSVWGDVSNGTPLTACAMREKNPNLYAQAENSLLEQSFELEALWKNVPAKVIEMKLGDWCRYDSAGVNANIVQCGTSLEGINSGLLSKQQQAILVSVIESLKSTHYNQDVHTGIVSKRLVAQVARLQVLLSQLTEVDSRHQLVVDAIKTLNHMANAPYLAIREVLLREVILPSRECGLTLEAAQKVALKKMMVDTIAPVLDFSVLSGSASGNLQAIKQAFNAFKDEDVERQSFRSMHVTCLQALKAIKVLSKQAPRDSESRKKIQQLQGCVEGFRCMLSHHLNQVRSDLHALLSTFNALVWMVFGNIVYIWPTTRQAGDKVADQLDKINPEHVILQGCLATLSFLSSYGIPVVCAVLNAWLVFYFSQLSGDALHRLVTSQTEQNLLEKYHPNFAKRLTIIGSMLAVMGGINFWWLGFSTLPEFLQCDVPFVGRLFEVAIMFVIAGAMNGGAVLMVAGDIYHWCLDHALDWVSPETWPRATQWLGCRDTLEDSARYVTVKGLVGESIFRKAVHALTSCTQALFSVPAHDAACAFAAQSREGGGSPLTVRRDLA